MIKPALSLAALLLLPGAWTVLAQAQSQPDRQAKQSSSGDGPAAQSSSAPSAPPAQSGDSGGLSNGTGKNRKSKSDRAGAGAAKADAKGCSQSKTQPCVDAPQPTSAGAADQFAFPEDISRKAAQAAGSGLPDKAVPEAPVAEPGLPGAPSPEAQASGTQAARAGGGSNSSRNPFGGAATAGTPANGIPVNGIPANGGNPFPMPMGKSASTPGWGGLRRRGADPNDPNTTAPAEPSSSSSSSGDPGSANPGSANPDSGGPGSGGPGSGGPGSGNSGSGGSPAHDSPGLQLQDAGSSGQMIDSYRAENDDDVADFYNKNGNYQGAYMRYQDAVHFNPDDEPAQYGLAEMAQKLGHMEEAIEHYQAYLKMAPSGSRAKEAERALKRLGVSTAK